MTSEPTWAINEVRITEAAVRFFATFGFLKIPRAFLSDIEEISEAFDEVMQDDASGRQEINAPLRDGEPRLVVNHILEKHPRLSALRSDARITSVARALLGPHCKYSGSDGNLFTGDTHWHADVYPVGMWPERLKLALYLDPLDGSSGAIRVIPGSHVVGDTFSRSLRSALKPRERFLEAFAIDGADLPSWTITNVPGDLIVWSHRILHATFGGRPRRRLLAIGFKNSE